MSDRLNFDQAAQHLGVSAEELQGLVSNQEIRAEHDGGEVYFSQQDLDAYKEGRSTEPTVVLSEDGGGMLEDEGLELEDFSTDETVLNIEGLLEDDGGSLLEGESELDLGGVGDETVIDTDDLSLDSFDFEEEAGGDAGGDEMLFSGNTEMQMVRKKPATAMTVLMVLTLLCLLIPAALLLNLMNPGGTFPDWGNHGAVNFMNGLVESIVNSL
ncbi:MAG: helix-turn-helix domain-containing protein [Planctomycetes bacterium]|nr:helix-turn-helix domain-containing protein [Planctomycetota bacterium]